MQMFPAPAGMSPKQYYEVWVQAHVPRTRGDEPWGDKVDNDFLTCSPHPRG